MILRMRHPSTSSGLLSYMESESRAETVTLYLILVMKLGGYISTEAKVTTTVNAKGINWDSCSRIEKYREEIPITHI